MNLLTVSIYLYIYIYFYIYSGGCSCGILLFFCKLIRKCTTGGGLLWTIKGRVSGIYSDIQSGILSDIYSDILSDILCGIFSGILSDIYSGSWHSIWHIFWHSIWHSICPAVPTGLGRSLLEVQHCPPGSGGPRLRSSGAHWTREVPGWGRAVPTDIGRWLLRSHWDRELAVEIQQCPLRSGAGEEARRKRRRRRRRSCGELG